MPIPTTLRQSRRDQEGLSSQYLGSTRNHIDTEFLSSFDVLIEPQECNIVSQYEMLYVLWRALCPYS